VIIHPSAYQIILTFGKFKGSTLGYLAERQRWYIEWLVGSTLPEVWRSAAARVLEGKAVDDLALPKTRQKWQPPRQNASGPAGIVLKDKNTAAVRFPYNEDLLNRIKGEVDGRVWNGDAKCWEFPAVQLPKVVTIFGGEDKIKWSPQAQQRYLKEVQRRRDLDEIRVKEDTDLPELKQGMKYPLYGFQKVGVEFVMRAGGRAMIADQMGLGKTIQAIGYALATQSKTLIVCPKSVTLQWADEIEKFTGKNTTIWTTQSVVGHGNNQFHVINYDAVRKQAKKLTQIDFDLLVCDEATYLKNRRTIRAKSVLGAGKNKKEYPGIKTKNLIFLTGTPILNRPIEAYYLLNAIDKQRFNNFYHFARRYGGWQGDKPRNLEELHDRTKDVVIRRLRSKVMPELPGKQRTDVHIELDKDERKQYTELLKELFKSWHFTGQATVSTMPKIQGFLSSKKLERTREIIDEYLENDRALVIFSIYIDPLKQLKSEYGDQAELLYGQTSTKERRAIIKRLQAGKSKIALIGLKAGGMALDGLQYVTDTVIFLNQDWVPGNHEQAEDRTDRIGQTTQVQVLYLLCKGTIDDDMRELLAEKQVIIDTVADGELLNKARSQSTFKTFVKRLSARFGEDFDA
jgi:SNF2 family DNA or RNA helicase